MKFSSVWNSIYFLTSVISLILSLKNLKSRHSFIKTKNTVTETFLADFFIVFGLNDRLCGLVVRVLGYRSGGPGSIPGITRKKKVVGLERGPLSLLSITEELLDRKVAAPV
jgi:hypothetical protein